MKVTSTEIQNNFGKYLMLASKEDIIITKNGTEIAKLSAAYNRDACRTYRSEVICEGASSYSYGGRKATYEEFLELTKDNEDRYEYIDGEIYFLSSPKAAHQMTLTNLLKILFVGFEGKKCIPIVAPFDITLTRPEGGKNLVQPDIMVICDLKEKLDERDYYIGVPSLVVEILSESTLRKDIIKKLDLYLSCGIEEYWIVNPANKEIAIYHFNNGKIADCRTFRQNETAESFFFEGLTADLGKVFG